MFDPTPNHVMLLVGWRTTDLGSDPPYWIAKNSYGPRELAAPHAQRLLQSRAAAYVRSGWLARLPCYPHRLLSA